MPRLLASLTCCLLLAVLASVPWGPGETGEKSAAGVSLLNAIATFGRADLHAATGDLVLEPSSLNFAATSGGGDLTGPQDVLVSIVGGLASSWTATSVTPACGFLQVAGGSGTGNGQFTVSIQDGSYPAGATVCQIQVSSPGAPNSPVILNVQFTVYSSTAGPFGVFETPLDNTAGVAGSIPVTGWALDDIEVATVQLWRDTVGAEVSGHPNGKIFIGDADFVEGARPDVAAAFATSPKAYRAGWGYMLLTNMLPDQGNGTFTLYVYATDLEGKQTLLGNRTITCDNASATKPFGTIDTPTQGGTASGSAYVNFGWALTSFQQNIPTDGSTIWVYVDGSPLGNPSYNHFRQDIADLFPGYANANGAVGHFAINTMTMTNGVHTIAWVVTDSGGNTAGIGSRYFEVFNAGGAVGHASPGPLLGRPETALAGLAPATQPVAVRTGFDPSAAPVTVASTTPLVEISELGRVDLRVGPGAEAVDAYLVSGGRLSRLAAGAALDRASGRLTWHPGPGHLGDYELALVQDGPAGRQELTRVTVRVAPHPVNGPDSYARLLYARATTPVLPQ